MQKSMIQYSCYLLLQSPETVTSGRSLIEPLQLWSFILSIRSIGMKFKGTVRTGQPELIRFMAKVLLRRSDTDCWLWIGAKNKEGYGIFCLDDKTTMPAHRWSFMRFRTEEFKTNLTCDHLCRNHACVNPYHLEMVTLTENILRGIGPTAINKQKTHCKRGHPLTGTNLLSNNGRRECRQCRRITRLAFYHRHIGKNHHTWSKRKGINDE